MTLQRQLMRAALLTSGLALLLTLVGFVTAQLITLRESTVTHLASLGNVIAANSSAALAFHDTEAAREILGALRADPSVVAAELFDQEGNYFAAYPISISPQNSQQMPVDGGHRFEGRYLIDAYPVVQNGARPLGTLVLTFDMAPVYQQLLGLGAVAALVAVIALFGAYLLSRALQRQISEPIAALVATASAVSDRSDYSVRAARVSNDELGRLTDTFNKMLTRIEEQRGALLDSEGRVRAVLDSALSAVVVIDTSGRILDWNQRAESMFGWQREEAVGLNLVTTIIPERYRSDHLSGMQGFNDSGAMPILNQLIELSALRRDGTEFPVELSISAITTGSTTTFCGFVTDITERRQAQRRIESQLNRMNLHNRITRAIGDRQDLPSIFRVVLKNLEDNMPIDFGCVLLYDNAGETLTVGNMGASSALLARQFDLVESMQIPLEPSGLVRSVRGELLYEPDLHDSSFAFPRRLSAAGLGSLVVAPLLVESRVFGVVVAARRTVAGFSSGDCEFLRQLSEHVGLASHQAHLHSALQLAYDELRQTQKTVMQQERLRALGQMASGVAHDINNAISPIALYTESLLEREPGLSDRGRRHLTTIQQAIEDVAQTVGRMREFYRPREAQFEQARVDLNRVVQQVIELTRVRWSDVVQERGIVITPQIELAAALPTIMGVESEIRDALTNLVFNAVDAMPDGGMLSICTCVSPSPAGSDSPVDEQVVLEVRDTGVGMDEDTRRRCMEPFFTTKGERGSGLGLAMVYGMVRRHTAELDIESAPRQGTVVRVKFAVPASGPESAVRLPTETTTRRPLRLLIVDDDPVIIDALREILEGDGHAVTAADGGRKGIELFAAAQAGHEPFAAVVTDLGMPYVDGRQVAAEVKALSAATPVLLLTGWGQRLLDDRDIPPCVDRVLKKPPRLRELRTALAELTLPPRVQ
ncbi:PAS domain S-box protein [Povalibacter sp.]|uniref:PAS domain S-box protein n=1 Tax=Povalibacter sp. TaxID=1962978 RepID=UPI002F3F62DE